MAFLTLLLDGFFDASLMLFLLDGFFGVSLLTLLPDGLLSGLLDGAPFAHIGAFSPSL